MIKPRKRKNESVEVYNERAIKAYFKDGYHIKEISERLKIDEIEVYNCVAAGNKITTEAEREEMIRLFNQGYSYTAISKIFNKSRTCVSERIKNPAKLNFKGQNNNVTDAQLNNMKDMASNGETLEAISKKTGIDVVSVKYRLSHTDIRPKVVRRVSKSEVNKFIKLYKSGKSYAEIAKICNRGRNTVNRHLHKAGVV